MTRPFLTLQRLLLSMAVLSTLSLGFTAPAFAGSTILDGLSLPFQQLTERALEQVVAKRRARGASAVVLDPKTGQVLALAYVAGKGVKPAGGQPAITEASEPGAVIAPLLVAAALEKGAVAENFPHFDTGPGYFLIGNLKITGAPPHKSVTIGQALAGSYNMVFSQLAQEMDAEAFWRMLDGLCLGHAPGSGLPDETAGQVPYFGQLSHVDRARLAFGHGMTASLLQLARAYGAIANEGLLVPLAREQLDPAAMSIQAMTPAAAGQVRRMLMGVTGKGGTAPMAKVPGVEVAGNTATSVKKMANNPGTSGQKPVIARFIGIAPALHPRLVVAVMVDEPQGKNTQGGTVAAPVFSNIMRQSLKLLEGMDRLPARQARVGSPITPSL